MRQNSRVQERYELSLDGRQVASIVVGALVVLGAVFVLGLHVGRQLAAVAPASRAENPLAALDRAPDSPSAGKDKEPRLSFHDALTKGSPETAPIPDQRPAAEPGAAAAGTALNALPPARASAKASPPAAGAEPIAPARKPAGKDPMTAAVARVSSLPAEGAAGGRFAVQVGATQSESEAQRLQRKLAAEGARVVSADVAGKGRWYRIHIGSYASRVEAERRRAELAGHGVKGFVAQER